MKNEIEERFIEILNPEQRKKEAQEQNILLALDYLNKAAAMLDEDKQVLLAEAVLQVMERVPKSLEQK